MEQIYIARIALNQGVQVNELEGVLRAPNISEPDTYVISSTPLAMLVSPYVDRDGRDVRSFEVTKYLVEQGIISGDPKEQGPVTQEMAEGLLGN